ncbi:MAG: prolyl oligopeptidase family serine peptidase [Planctomycetia bacterium]|nr:prolyl oligopeptidase family serine peptidase [Planctomycetia bacterium]
MTVRNLLLCSLFIAVVGVRADGPGDNLPDKVRRIPPVGIAVNDDDRAALQAGLDQLAKEIEGLRTSLKGKAALLELLPDVQIYHKAVLYALKYQEFHNAKEIPIAQNLLKTGLDRAKSLREGQAPWTTATGPVVRGYLSKIDGSVQPYGLVVPASFRPPTPHQFRLDCWFHGRGETLSEVNFINGRQASPGEFVPANAFVLHPYGRYCNANKFAGEIDLLEALEHVKKHYPIDDDRISVRGFSMGGAACWQFAVHYPGLWAAAAPGAGFSETAEFLNFFQNEKVQPTWYEKKLWHWYDCTDYALNLVNCPTVAYSGEIDKQKQAADAMARALKAEGIELTHIIGPKTGHSYHPDAKREINRRIDSIVEYGRQQTPFEIKFTTWTLRYHQLAWLSIDGLEEHWERARVNAELFFLGDELVIADTKNVSALTFALPAGRTPRDWVTKKVKVSLDGQVLDAAPVQSDRSWTAHFRKQGDRWQMVEKADDGTLRKRPGLQGPIDDAFMDSFLMVRPTGQAVNDKVGKWVEAESKHALDHWRQQFRGDARVKDDAEVSEADIAAHNLVLWGDPSSNRVLAKIADKLPIRWSGKVVSVGGKEYDPAHHVPVLIYPNPLNPKRYVVLNSGFTYREYDYLNNARQVPKLPDFTVVDVNVPMSSRSPGGIVTAGFFNEHWELPAAK